MRKIKVTMREAEFEYYEYLLGKFTEAEHKQWWETHEVVKDCGLSYVTLDPIFGECSLEFRPRATVIFNGKKYELSNEALERICR